MTVAPARPHERITLARRRHAERRAPSCRLHRKREHIAVLAESGQGFQRRTRRYKGLPHGRAAQSRAASPRTLVIFERVKPLAMRSPPISIATV